MNTPKAQEEEGQEQGQEGTECTSKTSKEVTGKAPGLLRMRCFQALQPQNQEAMRGSSNRHRCKQYMAQGLN